MLADASHPVSLLRTTADIALRVASIHEEIHAWDGWGHFRRASMRSFAPLAA